MRWIDQVLRACTREQTVGVAPNHRLRRHWTQGRQRLRPQTVVTIDAKGGMFLFRPNHLEVLKLEMRPLLLESRLRFKPSRVLSPVGERRPYKAGCRRFDPVSTHPNRCTDAEW